MEDLYSKNEGVQTLALNLIADQANQVLAETLHTEVLKIALGQSSISIGIRGKAILTLAKII